MAQSREQIVERQVKEWLTRRKASAVSHAPGVDRVVTITGQYGAMADTVGEEVASRLGFTLYDRQMVNLIAERAEVAPSLVEAAERGDQTYLQDLFDAMMSTSTMRSPDYVPQLTDVVAFIAERGRAVLLGRAANFILGPERALRVRCIAPITLRVDRVARHLGVGLEEAAKMIAREDDKRVRMVRSLMGQDPTDPAAYDLVVSTANLTPEHAATAVVALYRAVVGVR